MTSGPGTTDPEEPETRHDDGEQQEANEDAPATTEDQAANMDYEGDTPH
ncbi:hypothetical protein [Nocardia sp. NPDC006630]